MTLTETSAELSISGSIIILLIFLFIASFSMPLMKKLRFPHSVFLVIAGIVIGICADRFTGSEIPWIAEIAMAVSGFSLSSDAILFIFLPTLIFESAYNINSRELIKDMPYVLVLALPALLISILTVGLMLHYLAGFSFEVSFLFGALISATDPVAVIAIFKELGAPKRLTMLVEGESLFNDATSVVAFTIILGFITSADMLSPGQTAASGAAEFLLVFVGGTAVGLVTGYIFAIILGMIRNNPSVEIIITTMLAYISFILAHHYLHVSGVMSTVTAGLLLSSYGRTKISFEVHEFMESFWQTMSFSANAILFICIGLLMIPYLSLSILADLPQLLVAIIAVNIGRAIPVFSLLPFLSFIKFVEKISIKFISVIWWGGGLRGAIAIALALSLIDSGLPQEYQRQIMLLTFGIVIFTLGVNGLSIRKVMHMLKVDRLSKDEVYAQKMGLMHSKTLAIENIRSFNECAVHYPGIHRRLIEEYASQEEELHRELAAFKGIDEEEKFSLLAREALLREKRAYFESFTRKEISGSSLRDLQHQIDLDLDRLKSGRIIIAHRHQFESRSWLEALIRPFRTIMPESTAKRLAMRYEKACSTTEAIKNVYKFLEEKESENPELSDDCKRLKDNYASLRAAANQETSDFRVNFPEYAESVVEIIMRKSSLRTELEYLTKMHLLGQLPELSYNNLKEAISREIDNLSRQPLKKMRLNPVGLLRNVNFFSNLDRVHLERLSTYLHTKLFMKGEHLIEEGQDGEEMFIITRGRVRVYRGEQSAHDIVATLKNGGILGEMALISDSPRNASAIALTHCAALVLKKKHFEDFLQDNPEVKEKIFQVYKERE